MNIAALISKKRDGASLTDAEIDFLVKSYAGEDVPDYQMAAFAMAVYFQGMSAAETVTFTRSMVETGQRLAWPAEVTAVDKHSTGGVGDKTSIALAPLLACCDVVVPMISGRGLGATGGTLDKLESIPGYRTDLSNDEFRSIVNFCGCSIASASASLAPADKRLYALRDVTATVASIPLITASILSKKFAEGISSLVLDVKWGSGAFMQTLDQAHELASNLVTIGNQLGIKTSALVTDMNQPLGRMIGNAVEINEAVDVLRGQGPSDTTQLTVQLAANLLRSAGVCTTQEQAVEQTQMQLDSGAGYERLAEMVKAQGGDLDAPRRVSQQHAVVAPESGYLSRVNTRRLGLAVIEMGGGRKKIGDPLDHSVGIEFLLKIGDRVEVGQPIAYVFCDTSATTYACELVAAAVGISPTPVEPLALIVDQESSD